MFALIHTIFSLVFRYFVHLAIHSSLFTQPVGPLFNIATSRININIFNHLVWQRNWGAAAVCTATFNSCSEIGWTWLPPFKNILLDSNFGNRYNYRFLLKGRQNWDKVTQICFQSSSLQTNNPPRRCKETQRSTNGCISTFPQHCILVVFWSLHASHHILWTSPMKTNMQTEI